MQTQIYVESRRAQRPKHFSIFVNIFFMFDVSKGSKALAISIRKFQVQNASPSYNPPDKGCTSKAQANNSVLNDIEQYRRNHWYSNIVKTMRNHSGLTKTFLDQLIIRYLNLRFYCYILAVSVNRISMYHQLQLLQHRHSGYFSM